MRFLKQLIAYLGIDLQWSKGLALFLLSFVSIRSFLVDWFEIPTSSMSPTLYRGDYVVIAKYAHGYSLLSIWLNLGTYFIPHKIRYHPNGKPIPINIQTNSEVCGGKLFYINFADVKPGDIVCLIDPRIGGLNMTKRVVGVSGDRIQMIDNDLYRNGEKSERVSLGLHYYRDDLGYEQKYELFEESLAGTKKKYKIQYLLGHRKCTTKEFIIPPAITTTDIFGRTVKLEYFMVIGDNRDKSSDSRHNQVMLRSIPKEWIVGTTLGTACSSHKHFVSHSYVSGITVSWAEFAIETPWRWVLNAKAFLTTPERVGLIIHESYRAPKPVNSLMVIIMDKNCASDASTECSSNNPESIASLTDSDQDLIDIELND